MKAEVIVILAPVAGSEPEVKVPHDETWVLHSVKSFLVTDATVADREVRIIVDSPDGQGTFTFVPSSVLQVASQSRTYQFGDYGYRGAGAINVGVAVGVGKLVAPGNSRVRLSTTNLQPADKWSELFLVVEKFKN